jgi:hypothetical protein
MIEVAADWWYKTLGGRQKYDNGDKSREGGIAMTLAMLAAPAPPSTDKLNKFRAAMVAWLQGKVGIWTILDVDYGPGWELQQIEESAGVSGIAYPWKTTMWLDWDKGTVRVRHGYGAEIQDLEPCRG